MSNSLLTDSMITKECLRELKNQLTFTKSVNRQYDDKFAQVGAKKGASINIRKPSRYEVNDGAALVINDTEDEYVPLTLDNHKHVGMAFSQKDLTLSIDEFSDRYIKKAMTPLANSIDFVGYSAMYKKVFSSVGVPSASAYPSTLKGFTQAKAKIAGLGGSIDPLSALVNPLVEASLVEGLSGLFQSSEKIGKQYEKGEMGMAAGSTFKMSQNVSNHTAGAVAGTPAIRTTITAQGAAAVALDGITGTIVGCYKEGDSIQIGGVYSVNPQTKQSTGQLAQFVVTADTDSASNEINALGISPAIYSTGAKQNVTALPVDGALVTQFGSAAAYSGIVCPQNMVFHKDAFVLGCADFELPSGVDMAKRAVDAESGLSISMVRAYDINNHRTVTRLDVLFGWACVYPEFACRVVGQPG